MANIRTPLSRELLEELKLVFPNRCPLLTDTDREVWFKAGQAFVVHQYLQHQYNLQQKKDAD